MNIQRKGKLRAWKLYEFNNCSSASADERDDLAWAVPDCVGLLDPSVSWPVEDIGEAAEKFAQYCQSQRDGWEWTWPQTFVVCDGTRFLRIEVVGRCGLLAAFTKRETLPPDAVLRVKEMGP